MKANVSNLSSIASTELSRATQAERTGSSERSQEAAASAASPSDDVHLSELVRSLRALAADSPERQARLEEIARAYASGAYKIDAKATAAKIIDDALQYP